MSLPAPDIYPDLETLLEGEDQESLLRVRRSVRSVLAGIALFIVTAVLVYILNFYFGHLRLPTDLPLIRSISLRWLAVIPAGIALELVRRYNDDLYVLGVEVITHYEGRLSLNYKVPAIKYAHIRAIAVDQSILARIFDYGTIALGTAAQEGSELSMYSVRAPRELAALIEELQRYNREILAMQEIGEKQMSE